ncbi:MAG: hypothetical protein ACMXYA_01750, partial [Candidatus Woesearchaeota archaeon]
DDKHKIVFRIPPQKCDDDFNSVNIHYNVCEEGGLTFSQIYKNGQLERNSLSFGTKLHSSNQFSYPHELAQKHIMPDRAAVHWDAVCCALAEYAQNENRAKRVMRDSISSQLEAHRQMVSYDGAEMPALQKVSTYPTNSDTKRRFSQAFIPGSRDFNAYAQYFIGDGSEIEKQVSKQPNL